VGGLPVALEAQLAFSLDEHHLAPVVTLLAIDVDAHVDAAAGCEFERVQLVTQIEPSGDTVEGLELLPHTLCRSLDEDATSDVQRADSNAHGPSRSCVSGLRSYAVWL
jgi:hypothetical protein